jgi:hypothetical protein
MFYPGGDTLPTILAQLPERERAFEFQASFLAEQPGPAICERLILCYEAGKPYVINPFVLRIRERKGEGNNDLVKQIAGRKFAAIQTDNPLSQRPSERFPDDVLDAIDRYYVEAVKAPDCHIYVPRP